MPNRLQWLRDRLTDDHALIGVFIVAFLLAALVWFLWILAGGGLLGILNQARPSKRPNGQRCSSYRGGPPSSEGESCPRGLPANP